FHDIQFDAQKGATIKEARNIEFHNVRITTKEGSSLMAEHVNGLVIDAVKTLKPVKDKPTIDLNDVQDVFVYHCNVDKETAVFLSVRGTKTAGVSLKNNNCNKVLQPVVKDASL